jgi:hypothetical protein
LTIATTSSNQVCHLSFLPSKSEYRSQLGLNDSSDCPQPSSTFYVEKFTMGDAAAGTCIRCHMGVHTRQHEMDEAL